MISQWLKRKASADTHPKGGDSTQIEAPAPLSSAVAKPDAQNLSPSQES